MPLIARMLPMLLVAFVGLLARAQSGYQPPTFVPAMPNSRDEIVAILQTPGLCVAEDGGTTVSGSIVRTDIVLNDCFLGPPAYFVETLVTFGPVPAGTYTYVVYHDWRLGPGPELVSSQQLVVLPATEPVPGLTLEAQIAMILLIATVGVLFVSRRCV